MTGKGHYLVCKRPRIDYSVQRDVGRDESQIKVVSPCLYRPAIDCGCVVYFCRVAEILAGLGIHGPAAHARRVFWNLLLQT